MVVAAKSMAQITHRKLLLVSCVFIRLYFGKANKK